MLKYEFLWRKRQNTRTKKKRSNGLDGVTCVYQTYHVTTLCIAQKGDFKQGENHSQLGQALLLRGSK